MLSFERISQLNKFMTRMLVRLLSNARSIGMCKVHFRHMKSKVYRLRLPIGLSIADHQKPIDCNCRETEIDTAQFTALLLSSETVKGDCAAKLDSFIVLIYALIV